MFLLLLISVCLLFIFYQDMRYRAVYWICFPVLIALLSIWKVQCTSLNVIITDALYGLLFLGFQLFLLWGYIFFKHKRPVNIMDHYLGLGDVLFLLALVFYLSPVNYVIFYIVSLVMVLLYAVVQLTVFKRKDLKIPLAGLQALLFMLLLVLSVINRDLQFYSDFWVWNLALHL